jgi:transcriptional regulator GlxA family with amidase domain
LWRLGAARADVAGLAEDAAVTERQLHRRFVHAVGYGPRLLQRVLRLQAFLALCGSPRLGLAELAVRAGYADQSHLSRDTRELAGRTPAELRASRTHVRNVQDS